jgi:hypothetical protein
VLFRNLRYYSNLADVSPAAPYMSVIAGYDAQHKVKNITFEGLKINGRHVYDDMPGKPRWYATSDYVPLYVGSHVENVIYK